MERLRCLTVLTDRWSSMRARRPTYVTLAQNCSPYQACSILIDTEMPYGNCLSLRPSSRLCFQVNLTPFTPIFIVPINPPTPCHSLCLQAIRQGPTASRFDTRVHTLYSITDTSYSTVQTPTYILFDHSYKILYNGTTIWCSGKCGMHEFRTESGLVFVVG